MSRIRKLGRRLGAGPGAQSKTRITFDQQMVREPTWSPDGKTTAFSAQVTTGGGNVEFRSKAADGSGTEQTLFAEQDNYHYPAWSPDGRYLTYLWGDGEKMVSLWIRQARSNRAAAFVAIESPSLSNFS
jgi:Tol biopolymer transport system component